MILTQTIVEEMSRYFTYAKVRKYLASCTLSVELDGFLTVTRLNQPL